MTELDFAVSHRRLLHQIPETSMEEIQTTAHIIKFLDEFNIPYERPLETGVVAYLDGNSDRTFAFRADIDALPIHEENDVEFRSKTDRSEEHTSELQSRGHLVCRLLLEK